MHCVLGLMLLSVVSVFSADDSVLSQEFTTNHFTDNDTVFWTISGNNPPSDHYFTECGSQRIFGGYKKFGGDPSSPHNISRHYTGLIAHYGVRIQAKIYKIDSWNNQNLYLMVDNVAVNMWNYGMIGGNSSQICGDPYPVLDSINNNFNDSIINLDLNFTHHLPTLDVSFQTDLNSDRGWWGIRQIVVSMFLCDKSCLSCANQQASCLSCDNLILDFNLVGAYCQCTALAKIKQKKSFCSSMPCVGCLGMCSPGYYLSTVTSACQPCHQACATCTKPTNTDSTDCITCNAGFFRTLTTTACFNCMSGCAICTALSLTACTSCKKGYFFHFGQCLTSCPNGTYPQQNIRQCSPCSSSCNTCNGQTGLYCTSCTGSLYLTNTNQCLSLCNPPFLKYNNTCLQQCPIGTYQNIALYECVACLANCNQCNSIAACTKCKSGFYLLAGMCPSSCPSTHYASVSSNQCLACHLDCLSCFGLSSTSCFACSDASKILINAACYTSCPKRTFSSLCIPCHQNCLQCTGPNQNQCSSCPNTYFLDLKSNKCALTCKIGSIVDKVNFTCTSCPNSMVGYFHQCVACSRTCQTCYGTSYLQCSTCDNFSNLYVSTCIKKQQPKIVKSQAYSFEICTLLTTIYVIILVTCVLLEICFTYKTPLLPTLQYVQILAYFYFLSVPMSQQVQRVLHILYYSNFTTLLSVDFSRVAQGLPLKLMLAGKSGYYAIDTIGLHCIVLSAVIILLLLKKFKPISRILQVIYQKLNPYLMSYLYRLVILDQFFSLIIYLRYGDIQTFIGILSLVIVFIDVIALALTFFWKIKPKDRQNKQYALFYFNEITEKYMVNSNLKVHNQNDKKTILLTFVFYVGKVPFVLAIVYFIANSTYQVISTLGYAAFFLIIICIVPYKRKTYRFLYVLGAATLLISTILFVCVNNNQALSMSLEVVWLMYFLIVFIVVFLQFAVNFRYFTHFFTYAVAQINHFLTTKSNQISDSQITVIQEQKDNQVVQSNFKQEHHRQNSQQDSKQAQIELHQPQNVLDQSNQSNNFQSGQNLYDLQKKANLFDGLRKNQKINFKRALLNKQNQFSHNSISPKKYNKQTFQRNYSGQHKIQLDFDL